jgi:threonine dehydrogenase-like Zn-dependent dehydrogenase
MRAALFVEPRHIDVGDRPDASIAEPTDAVVRVMLACDGGQGEAVRVPLADGSLVKVPDDVLEGRINPGRVLDYETDLDGVADAYAAMDERRAIKSLVRVGTL